MEKDKALDAALTQIERTFGKGSIMRLGQNTNIDIEAISTGSLGTDIALGIGGLPKGRIIEIYGPESSGKTTFALSVVAQAQKKGGICAFVDAEHALDPSSAKKIGVDIENLLVSQPDSGEQALEIADTLVRSGAIDVLVVDSVAALVPKAELEGEMGDSHMGLQARLILQVHDELIVECPAEEAETVKAILVDEMEHVVDYRVPLLVDAKIGASWAEAH